METFARDPETSLPIFYIYDSYQIKPEDWYQEFSKIRDTEWDAYIVGLIVEGKGINRSPKRLVSNGSSGPDGLFDWVRWAALRSLIK